MTGLEKIDMLGVESAGGGAAGKIPSRVKPGDLSMTQEPTVADYMSHEVRSIHLEASLKEAGRLLQKYKVGSLLVDDGKRYVGIITDTDLSRKGVAQGLDPEATRVKKCMSRPVISIEDNEPLQEAVRLMKSKGIRHLAVTEDNTIIGVLSVSDVLRYFSGIE